MWGSLPGSERHAGRARGLWARARLCVLVLALWPGFGWAEGADAPARVVSMNLCTDQLALQIAAPGQLVSVSMLAADPMSSAMPEAAAGYRLNRGRAEEIFALAPDLVLAGAWSDPATVRLLTRLGVRVQRFDLARRVEDIPARLREMGAALGQPARAEALAAAFEARLARLALPEGHAEPEAAFWYANGYTLGAGSLAHDILAHAGFANAAARAGRQGGATMALEELVLAAPDLLVSSQPYGGASRAEEILRHPALEGLAPVALSSPEWTCGAPHVLNAVEMMHGWRTRLGPGQE
jgi:ABC-type Fe3+-hydroxamate transport system, periplasmic component